LPTSQKLNAILDEARQREKENNWIAAAKLYENCLDLTPRSNGSLEEGELLKKIGLCHRRAAMQAGTQESFSECMTSAMEAYSKAAKLYEESKGKQAEAFRCLATAYYTKYWLASTSIEKKELLDKYHETKTRVFRFYEEAHNEAGSGKAYNELLMCLCESDSDRATLEWDWSKRSRMIMESLGYGEQAINTFSQSGDNHELAKAYALTGKLCETARHLSELEDKKKELGQKSLNHLQKASELCKKADDHYLNSLVNIWLGISTADWEGNLAASLTYFEEAMRQTTKMRNRYLMGHAAHCLAYVAYWMSMIEQDQDKRKQGIRNAIKHEEEAIRHFTASSYVPISFWILPDSYSALAQEEIHLEDKLDLLEKAAKTGRETLKYAKDSGYFPRPDWGVYHGLSKALCYLSTLKTQADEKRALCEEALEHREESVRIAEQATPFDHWNIGVFRNYQALVYTELAAIEVDRSKKQELLEKAVQSMQTSLDSCLKRLKISPKPSLYVTVGKYHENYARILNQLYLLTENPDNLRKAVDVYKGAIDAYDKINWHSYAAEIHWRIASLYNKLDEYSEAAENFQQASEKYRLSAQETAPLRDFYLDHASYMQAWSLTERAKHSHIEEEYSQSKAYYEKAANIYKELKLWSYLTPNYSAWAHLEHGEDLSRKEKIKEAILTFQQAAELFTKAKTSLTAATAKMESSDEKEQALALNKASEVRREYCQGRMILEEARMHDREGNTALSAEKYSQATRVFQKVAEALDEASEQKELHLTINFCQAWEKLKLAEQGVTPALFMESSKLFEKTKQYTSREKTSLLAMGNSTLCKALEAATKFEASRDLKLYAIAKQNMESAANYYLKAGHEKASTWVNANEALLDAYAYMSKAETEILHDERTRQYQLAEKYLERSAQLYEKAGYTGKRDETLKALAKVREKREFALSLNEAFKPPTIASSTTVFSVPASTKEEAVGLERFEHVNIQAYLSAPEEAALGEEFEVRIDLANVAKETGLLVRIDELIPAGFEVAREPATYLIEGKSLNARGKQLAPQKVESLTISLKATQTGNFQLCPEVIYVDELGKFKRFKCEAVQISILPPVGFQFSTNNAQAVFEHLTKAFIEDYMKKRLPLEKSGWRTLVQIQMDSKVPKSSLYGTDRHRGLAISELERRGLIETRIFPGERGRGGKILKTRVAYEKETIKRYIDHHIMKNKEK
jgi:tetratricopeptide (TPR) repeat protein